MHQPQQSHTNQLATGLVAVTIFLIAGGVILAIKGAYFVCSVFAKHPKRKVLWFALAMCLVCVGMGVFLANRVSQTWQALAYGGVGILLLTCTYVDLQEQTLLLREQVNVIDEVINTSWWGSGSNTPTP